MTVLLTGAAGGLAQLVTSRLQDHRVVGVDVRPTPPDFPGPFVQVRRYHQRRMAEVFRQHRPRVLVHLGRVRAREVHSASLRYDLNVLGTRFLLELARQHGVELVVVLSTYHVYGADHINHVLIREDEPLRAVQTFPALADAVELDLAATTSLWRHRDVSAAVLRPVNIVGPHLRNLMSRLLRRGRVPKLLGYDPLMQFLHEGDAARAIAMAIEDPDLVGVFNIAGEGVIPWSRAIRAAGQRMAIVPVSVARALAGVGGIPPHLVRYFRFPTVVCDADFREATGFRPAWTTIDTLRAVGRSS